MKVVVLPILLLAGLLCAGAEEPPAEKLTPQQRLEPEHLRATHEARLRFAAERQTLPELGVYHDFRAVMHVHAEDADHTKGTREEVLAAANKAGVRAVLFTDHRGPRTNTWHGLRNGVLFLAGSEDGNGRLRFPTFDAEHRPQTNGALRFLCHVEERLDAATDGLDGMEICNRHSDAKLDDRFQQQLLTTAKDPAAWRKFLDNFKSYPDEMFAAGTDYRAGIFAKWDRETQQHPCTGIAANDAHQNVIVQGTTLDPYEVSFRNLSTHILARELTEPDIREALRDGHVYVSHDWLCDPTGFAFGAVNNLGVFPMGDPAPILRTTRLMALTPLPAKLKLFRNGELIHETLATNLNFKAKDPGAYRLEAWLTVDGEDRPWIYSNPVYLRAPGLAELRLPSMEISPTVEVTKGIVYTEGPAEDEDKHKLDLYVPKGKRPSPVFVFIHGGAWKSGDRFQYPPLGNRFAKAGILTVIPSYRLAPKHPHPAQIEDVAAAWSWVARHISEYGGDTNRLYVGGHSAGGHLAALLTLDEKYLKAHDLSPRMIRGTMALSGVFNLTIGASQSSVFGDDPDARRSASPLFHIASTAPPFLVTYCQWDYPTLPAQAREFHEALRRAGAASELVFVPREGHISEMIAITQEEDVTAKAVLKFIH